MTATDPLADIERLHGLLGEANKTIKTQERQMIRFGALALAARQVIEWAEWGEKYQIGRKPVDDLRAALKALNNRK